nr:putative phosphatidylinositol 4-phosphate 5-kinase 11 [Malus domestica]
MELLQEELSPDDFKATKTNRIKYTRQDSIHGAYFTNDFEWKDYSPAVFRRLLELDSIISYDDYLLTVRGDDTLREVSLPGRYGRVYILPGDKRLVIKTLRKSEKQVYLEMLPNYYRHVKKYGASLFKRLYGLHVIRPPGGIKVYFAVCASVMPSELCLYKCYDLKGSSVGRARNRSHVHDTAILKDLDFDFCFYLDPLVHARLLADLENHETLLLCYALQLLYQLFDLYRVSRRKFEPIILLFGRQIKYDCEFLEAEGIMDYSLLLGSIDKRNSRSFDAKKQIDDASEDDETSSELTLADICDLIDRPGFKFGDRLPARAVRAFNNGMESKSYRSSRSHECFNVLLFFGIIDFCQNYNMKKRIEHAFKAIKYDSKSINTVNPKAYSSRFQEFLSEVFLPEESDDFDHN